MEDTTGFRSPVDGTFQHHRATAYVLPSLSVSYSAINTLCSNAKTPFKGLALTMLHMCDIRANEGEVNINLTMHVSSFLYCRYFNINVFIVCTMIYLFRVWK